MTGQALYGRWLVHIERRMADQGGASEFAPWGLLDDQARAVWDDLADDLQIGFGIGMAEVVLGPL